MREIDFENIKLDDALIDFLNDFEGQLKQIAEAGNGRKKVKVRRETFNKIKFLRRWLEYVLELARISTEQFFDIVPSLLRGSYLFVCYDALKKYAEKVKKKSKSRIHDTKNASFIDMRHFNIMVKIENASDNLKKENADYHSLRMVIDSLPVYRPNVKIKKLSEGGPTDAGRKYRQFYVKKGAEKIIKLCMKQLGRMVRLKIKSWTQICEACFVIFSTIDGQYILKYEFQKYTGDRQEIVEEDRQKAVEKMKIIDGNNDDEDDDEDDDMDDDDDM